jgi:trehalose 6-phosphate phosphatase
LIEPLLADPAGSAILIDFDGTISPIVIDPASARALPEAVDLLHRLAATYGRVAVVSGRPASFLVNRLDLAVRQSGLLAVGLYGMEQSGPGGKIETLAGESWLQTVERAASEAEAEALPGVVVERKGLSFTLHWREAAAAATGSGDALAEATTGLGEELAARYGLEARHGRMSVELVPPVGVDKGAAVRRLCEGRANALYAGDDVGDLAAFAALDDLAGALHAVKVAVASTEAPPALLAEADLIVSGPVGVVGLLAELASVIPRND